MGIKELLSQIPIVDIVKIIREVDVARYLLYGIWVLPIFRAYKAFSKIISKGNFLSIWRSEERKSLQDARVAVLIPARNVSKYIGEVLRHVLMQKVKPLKVIIIDDMSDDQTFLKAVYTLRDLRAKLDHVSVKRDKIVEERYDLRGIKVVLKRNLIHLGKAKSLNLALKELNDVDYIMILDADTLIPHNYIERLLEVMERDPKAGAASGIPLLWKPSSESKLTKYIAKAFRETSFLVYALTVKVAESLIGVVATLSGCCVLIRKKALDEIGGIPEGTFAEDAELSLRLGIKGYKLYFVPETLAYTVDPGNPLELLKKFYRILRGMYSSFFKVLPRLLRDHKWGLLVTAVYNIFGGIPFTLSLVNVIATTFLAAKGYLSSSFLLYLASLLQFSTVSLILNLIAKYPLVLIGLSYIWGVVGSFLSLLFISKLYKDDKELSAVTFRAAKYSPFVPIVLWIQAVAMLPALISAIKDLIKGAEAKW